MKLKRFAAIIIMLTSIAAPAPVRADDPPVLKYDTPKIDMGAPSTPAPKKTLSGGIEHNENITAPPHKASIGNFIFGAGKVKEDKNRLRGAARNNNPLSGRANQMTTEAQSGIGIIGVKFVMVAGRAPVVNRVFPQTPAFSSGIHPADVIVAVDGVPTSGLSKEEVFDMIVGTPGTTVTVTIERSGDFQAYTMTRMDLNDITDPFIRRDYMMSI